MTNAVSHHLLPEPQPASAAQTVFFGIPLKAHATAKNWDWTVRDFNRTLASIYNQTNPNFRILVGCHDVPELLIPTDERLQFLQISGKEPDLAKDSRSIFPDRARKLRRVGECFRNAGGKWFMALDADDLVSSRLVEFVLSIPNPHGFIVRQGYLFDQESRAMAVIPDPEIYRYPFDQICGSSAILRFSDQDFPKAGQAYSECRFARFAGQVNHLALWRMSLEAGRQLVPLPFPGVAYVVNTGDNWTFGHTEFAGRRRDRLIPSLRAKSIPVDENLLDEFALRHPVWEKSDVKRIQLTNRPDDGFRIDFIGCGAQKSGTTSLSYYIELHPAIGMGIKKELHFFNDYKFFSGTSPNYSHYHNQFIRNKGAKIYGEVHSAYMYELNSMERIFRYNPKIKVLGILRNPIERAFSHWNMQVRDGHETLPFFKALLQESQRDRDVAPWQNWKFSYIERGYYTEQIRRIWRLFSPEQTLFIKSEDLGQNPEDTMAKIFTFLGVEPIPIPQTISYNKGGYEGTPSPEERIFLLHTFKYEIHSLERMLGWDCSSWLS